MMSTGMLWWIDNPKDGLDAAVRMAAAYYLKKYGQAVNMCHAHPTTIQPEYGTREDLVFGGIAVRAVQSVLPGHLMVGVEDALCST